MVRVLPPDEADTAAWLPADVNLGLPFLDLSASFFKACICPDATLLVHLIIIVLLVVYNVIFLVLNAWLQYVCKHGDSEKGEYL